MTESLEIEFKTLLNDKEYAYIVNYFHLKEKNFFTQTNYYFDTKDFQLKKMHMGLRIRVLDSGAEITLKIPQKIGLLEITDVLSVKEATELVNLGSLPSSGSVITKLLALGVDLNEIQRIGCLKTKRAEKNISQGLLALDESWYNKTHDFELELEVTQASGGISLFHSLLNELSVQEKTAPNKIQRMMHSSQLSDHKHN